jgi:hypothetical protein
MCSTRRFGEANLPSVKNGKQAPKKSSEPWQQSPHAETHSPITNTKALGTVQKTRSVLVRSNTDFQLAINIDGFDFVYKGLFTL